jgi:hypothetical protein
MAKPQLQITYTSPDDVTVIDAATRVVVFMTQGADALERAQQFYRTNSKRWPGEDKDTARVIASMSIDELAIAARPRDNADWGTERQITAETQFFDRVRALLTDDEFASVEDYALKATTDERIDHALQLVRAAR